MISRILWLPDGDDVESRHYDLDSPSQSSRNPAGIPINSETALKSTVVLACARVLAESLASLPLHLYMNLPSGGKEIAKSHPLYRRLHTSPNSWQTSFEWREQQVLWLALWGNSYNLIVPGEAGFATELQPLHPSRMDVEVIENGRLRYKYRDDKGKPEVYTQDQIMHIRWLSDDGIHGMVPVDLARDAIGLARACEIHGARYFGNGARPGFVLSTENDMKPESARELRDNWERMHRGADRANRTAVLYGGLKPVELGGANMQESQFLETRRFQIEEICRLYRVPPHLVGDLTRSSFSNIEQQSIDFVQHTLLPWCRRFENAFARDLIVEDDKYFAEFDTRGILRGDASARASYYQTMWNLGVASINEIRGWENLNPVEGGDTRFVQLNMQTLGAAAAPPKPEEPAATVADPAQEEPTADVGGLIAVIEQLKAKAITPEAAMAVIASVFPEMPPATAKTIVDGAVAATAAEQPAAPAAAAPQKEQPQAEPQAAQPSGRSLWQGDVRFAEARDLTISIDFDRTFSADPELWGQFAREAVSQGNVVVMITRREDTPEDRAKIEETLGEYFDAFSKIVLAGGSRQKEEAASEAGISVDIWIDDSPQTISSRGFCPTGPGGGIDNSCGKEGVSVGDQGGVSGAYRKESAAKAVAAEKSGDRREIVSYIAYRQFRDESSETPMKLIESVEKASSTESMYRAMQSGNDWQSAGGWESVADEWAAANALGANGLSSRTTQSALKSSQPLSETDLKAFEARRAFAVDALRKEYGDEITLYRGIKGSQAKKIKESGDSEVEFGVRSIASFATSSASASEFAGKNGVVVEVKVPVEDAWMVRGVMPRKIVSFSDDAGEVVLMNRTESRRGRVVR